jgi:hypothetical protein
MGNERVKLTVGRIEKFSCAEGRAQAFLWSDDPLGLAVRATPGSSRKVYVFQSKIDEKTIRTTIGTTQDWTIEAAKAEARRLQVGIDNGNDPRLEKQQQRIERVAKRTQQELEKIVVREVWNAYIEDRYKARKDGKPL